MDQNTVWVIAIAALIVGILLGFLFGRNGSNGSREIKLAEDLDRTQHELEKYRDEVNLHFSNTAELVNDLTNQYQKVHQHLAASAAVLCRDEKLVESLQKQANMTKSIRDEKPGKTTEPEVEPDENEVPVHMPLDYAPKKDQNEPGTLSDRFGLTTEQPVAPRDHSDAKEQLSQESDNKHPV